MPSPRTTTRWLVVSGIILLAAALFISPELREILTGHSRTSTHGRAGDPHPPERSDENTVRSTKRPRPTVEEALLKKVSFLNNVPPPPDGSDPFAEEVGGPKDLRRDQWWDIGKMVEYYVQTDPDKGIRWMLSLPVQERTPAVVSAFSMSLVKAQPEAWFEFLPKFPVERDDLRWAFIGSGILQVGYKEPEKAWELYHSLVPDLDSPVSENSERTVDRGRDVRMEIIREHPARIFALVKATGSSSQLREFFRDSRWLSFADTLDYLDAVENPVQRGECFISYLSAGKPFGENDMVQILREIERGASADLLFKDRALHQLVISGTDPWSAIPVALKISDETLREQTIQTLRDKAAETSSPALIQQFETAVQSHRTHSGR